MHHADLRRPVAIATAVAIALDCVVLMVQIAIDRPPIGALGLVLFLVPGFVVTVSVGPRPLAWPQIVLTVLGTTLIIGILTGIASAVSPQGLRASSVAGMQLVALGIAAGMWLIQPSRADVGWHLSTGGVKPASVLFIAAGLGLAGVGLTLATLAASAARTTGFVQLWSVPSAAVGQVVGVRNQTGGDVDCGLTAERPGGPALAWSIGRLENGESWEEPLGSSAGSPSPGQTSGAKPTPRTASPNADASVKDAWEIVLHCLAPDGSIFDRRLSVESPA